MLDVKFGPPDTRALEWAPAFGGRKGPGTSRPVVRWDEIAARLPGHPEALRKKFDRAVQRVARPRPGVRR